MDYENKICVGLPHTGTFSWNTTMALLALRAPKGYGMVYHAIGSSLIYDAREKIVEFARNNKCKYVVMLDSDMVPPYDMIMKMVEYLDHNKEIDLVTGTAFKRTPPFQPCFYTKCDYNLENQSAELESPVEFPDSGILPIAGAGMACCCIRTDLFDRIDEKKKDKKYFFPLPNFGEDLTFCLIARKCGAKMVADLSIDVGHVSAMPITREHFRACYQEHKRNHADKPLFEEGKA